MKAMVTSFWDGPNVAVDFFFFFQKVCAASKKKSLIGLDSIQTDGVCAFATLVETAERLCSLGK